MAVAFILFGTLTGTSLMTLFSYFLSRKANRNFREPVLLNQLLFDLPLFEFKSKPILPGWILHYAVGFIFVIGFHFFWKMASITPSLLSGSILGLFCGMLGVAGWHLVFLLHPKPPSIELKEYYIHLIVAHIIFGFGAAAGYKLVS
ncbi:MAG TPA: hypothetical protein VFM80_12060 [Gracilimonas sp.]|uniref:hypothetical protein n=1 Tax=Gracilimonas sp. TaxID=1974203 RepID=UPI002D9ED862|nr:hypothetical protein [Gracilimonas sp.]